MKKLIFLFIAASVCLHAQTNDSLMLRKIYDFYLTDSKSYSNLEALTKKIGGRLSGSANAEKAVY
ncbi:MAG: peptidase M28 family protein, partial [Sphingobacteriaceae bacterium]